MEREFGFFPANTLTDGDFIISTDRLEFNCSLF